MDKVLIANTNMFEWIAADMPSIHPNVMSHKLALFKEARLVVQKKRRLGKEKGCAMDIEVKKLL